MAYIDQAELKQQFPDKDLSELANDPTGQASDIEIREIIAARILDAQSFVDSYLNQKYQVPFADTAVPDSVRHATGVVAYYRLHERRTEMITEQVQQLYDQTVEWLRDIAKGIISLPQPPAVGGGKSSTYFGAETREFQGISHDNTTDMMAGF